MKRLTLIRHAKSSWKDLSLPDEERPLNRRGKRDAPLMAARFAERHDAESLVIVSSPAIRARATARAFAEATGYRPREIQIEPRIYEADVEALYEVVAGFPDEWAHAVVVGHNPGFTDFVNRTTKHFLENLPTCSIAELHYDIASWGEIGTATATLAEYDYPKKGEDPDTP